MKLRVGLVVSICAISGMASYLAFIVKQGKLLAAFLPLAMLPVFAGLMMTFFAHTASLNRKK